VPKPLLEIRDLQTSFDVEGRQATAVSEVSFDVNRNEFLGIVGESGSGKSVTALSIMRLIPDPPGHIDSGTIHYEGRDLLALSYEEMRAVRGKDIAMIFQEPMTSLNPVYTVGNQITEGILVHEDIGPEAARARAIELLAKVGMPSPETRVDEYPHQMSGGMRQRVMIAMSLACSPQLLIADEPTTALDVTIQAQILELMNQLQEEMGMSILLITHDLGVVAETCDDVVVMYAGKVVERADVFTLFERPAHPYTNALFESLPDLESEPGHLPTIPGMVPSAVDFPEGCRFRDRCSYATEACVVQPETTQLGDNHVAACHHLDAVQAAREGTS
jgi:oligopeptide/dipeptide ABC transporter ATP-binding protein